MEPIPATMQIPVTLEAQEWQQVLEVLGSGAWRVVNPLMQKITYAVQSHAESLQAPPPSPLNGQAQTYPGAVNSMTGG